MRFLLFSQCTEMNITLIHSLNLYMFESPNNDDVSVEFPESIELDLVHRFARSKTKSIAKKKARDEIVWK